MNADLRIMPDANLERSPSETIAAAAVYYDGLVYSIDAPARHYHILRAMMSKDVDDAAMNPRYQGFVTNAGRFVDRYEACRIARGANQLIRQPTPEDMLTSEDVW